MKSTALLAAALIALLPASMLAQVPAGPQGMPGFKPPAPLPPPFPEGGPQIPRGMETDPMVARRDALAIAMAATRRSPPALGSWATAERALFAEIATLGKYDILVAPVQSDGYAVDRVSRSLLAAHLADELGRRGLRVPNPYVVQRALGEGLRTLNPMDIAAFGEKLGVPRIVALAVSHDRDAKLHVSVTVFATSAGTALLRPSAPQRLAPVDLPEGVHPVEAARTVLPQVLRALAVDAPARPRAKKDLAPARMPASPAAALAATEPVALATSLQVMASLVPPSAPERARERLYEQALLAALELPDDHPTAALFRARAWRELGSRIAALRALGKAPRPDVLAFREILNGNLPEASAAAAKVADPVPRFLLEIDVQVLKAAYGVAGADAPGPALERLLAEYPAWAPLVRQRIAEYGDWGGGSPLLPWQLLETDLPVKGAPMADHLRGMQVIGRAPDAAAVAKGTLTHLRRVRKEDRALHACLDAAVACTRAAYTDLIESVLLSNLYRSIYKRGNLQGLYDAALDELRALKPEFDGQTELVLVEAQVRAAKAWHNRGPEFEREFAVVRSGAAAVAWLEQGATRTAFVALNQIGIPSPDSSPFLDAYFFDLPVRSYWYLWGGERLLGAAPTKEELARMLRARVDDAITDIGVVKELEEWRKGGGADLRREDVAKGRFSGHPERSALLAAQRGAPLAGDKLALLETARRERPDLWSSHLNLATHHVRERGDYAAAFQAFMAFPGFKDRNLFDAVTLGNHAYEAGSLFFWLGHVEETLPFYRIAADLRTGSAASISSQTRLALLNGDFRTAVELSLARGQRYDDPYAFRDYIAWLFAFGFSREAWAAFGQLHDKLPNPQVWLAADVGHRADRRDWPAVKQWLLSEPFKSSAINRDRFALRLAIMQAGVDRKPAADLPDTMRMIEGTPTSTSDSAGVSMPHTLGQGMMTVPRSGFRSSERAAFAKPEPVGSPFVLFTDAYVLLRAGDYSAAVEKFDRMAAFYPIEGAPLFQIDPYALPYFAWAAARSGDKLGLEAFVNGLDPSGRAFDLYLARAFFAGVKGDHAAATAHLKRAFDNRPYTEKRPIPTEYQWAEACEWLFTVSGDRRYVDLALPWAKVHQRIQPMIAWAYAFEAKYATKETDRVRALALALHLDAGSERVAGLPEGLKAKAREWLARNNPFNPKRKPGSST